MRTIPRELDEAAVMDGCNEFQILFKIIIPVIKPILITVALLSFMWGMNDFQGPLIYLNSSDKTVLSVALKQLLDGEAMVSYGRVFAASCLGLLPMIAIFFYGITVLLLMALLLQEVKSSHMLIRRILAQIVDFVFRDF